MHIRQVGLVAIGAVAGFAVAALIFRQPSPVPSTSTAGAAARDVRHNPAKSMESASQPAAALASVAQTATSGTLEELDAAIRAHAKQRRVEALLAAGFTRERIEWLQDRGLELKMLRDQRAVERKHKGLPYESQAAYVTDPDLDLRYEIGDEEYERYRVALGRPVGVTVDQIAPGSDAARVGLQPNDVIVGYDGKRIFNSGELYQLVHEARENQLVLVDVRRNGQPMQFTMQAPLLGIVAALPLSRLPGSSNNDRQGRE